MIEFKTEDEVVAFDGRVVTRFRYYGLSLHFHINFIESLKIESDKKGREHWLRINLKRPTSSEIRNIADQKLSPEEIPQAQSCVDEVNRGIASLQE